MGPRLGSNKLEAGQLHHLIKTSSLTQVIFVAKLFFEFPIVSMAISLMRALFIVVSLLDLFEPTTDGNFNGDFFQQTEESSQFREEYEMRKMKQASDT